MIEYPIGNMQILSFILVPFFSVKLLKFTNKNLIKSLIEVVFSKNVYTLVKKLEVYSLKNLTCMLHRFLKFNYFSFHASNCIVYPQVKIKTMIV